MGCLDVCVLPRIVCRLVAALAVVLARVAAHHETECKKALKNEYWGSQTPSRMFPEYMCHPEQSMAASAARSDIVVVVVRGTLRAKHVNTCSYDLEAETRVEIRVLNSCHINSGLLYEHKYGLMCSRS